jgi:hypothetical protein
VEIAKTMNSIDQIPDEQEKNKARSRGSLSIIPSHDSFPMSFLVCSCLTTGTPGLASLVDVEKVSFVKTFDVIRDNLESPQYDVVSFDNRSKQKLGGHVSRGRLA